MNELTVIDVVNVTKRFGDFRAIDNVSFSVKKGEVVGFVGLNGAGKSTTINLMLGFLRPTSGSVKLFGKTILPEIAHLTHRDIGFASGDMALFDNLSGDQYLAFLSRRYKLRDQTRVKELCDRFEPQLHKKIKELSRGNRQKIALIGAFMASPKLVILDEPSSGLDPLMQQAFLELVREEGGRGTTIFMSSHYLGEVADVCSRVLLMRKGRLVTDILAHQIEAAGGKMVHATAKYAVVPLKGAQSIQHRKTAEGHEVNFIYKGPTLDVQKWLASAPPLTDLTITEYSLEAAFSELYTKDAGEEPYV